MLWKLRYWTGGERFVRRWWNRVLQGKTSVSFAGIQAAIKFPDCSAFLSEITFSGVRLRTRTAFNASPEMLHRHSPTKDCKLVSTWKTLIDTLVKYYFSRNAWASLTGNTFLLLALEHRQYLLVATAARFRFVLWWCKQHSLQMHIFRLSWSLCPWMQPPQLLNSTPQTGLTLWLCEGLLISLFWFVATKTTRVLK